MQRGDGALNAWNGEHDTQDVVRRGGVDDGAGLLPEAPAEVPGGGGDGDGDGDGGGRRRRLSATAAAAVVELHVHALS